MSVNELKQIRKLMETVPPDRIVAEICAILRSGFVVESTIADGYKTFAEWKEAMKNQVK